MKTISALIVWGGFLTMIATCEASTKAMVWGGIIGLLLMFAGSELFKAFDKKPKSK